MSVLAIAALAVAAGESASGTPAPARAQEMELAQIVIQRRTIVRVAPVFAAPPAQAPISWKEKNAPKCANMSLLAGLAITRPDSIDLVLRGGQRLRAKLEKSCPSVDFYSGFYVKPHKDGRICEDRDQIHSRTGGACSIDKFKLLVPVKAKPKK